MRFINWIQIIFYIFSILIIEKVEVFSWETSFNSMQEVIILRTERGEVDYAKIVRKKFEGWPDNKDQWKMLLDLKNFTTGAIMAKEEMKGQKYQCAEIEFRAPEGITNHIVLSIQSSIKKEGIYGYMLIIGYDPRLCGNRTAIPCQRPYIGIEKSAGKRNWIFGGIPIQILNHKTYKLRIESKRMKDYMEINAYVYSWDFNYEWVLNAVSSHLDYNRRCEIDGGGNKETFCNFIQGEQSFFGDVFSNKKTYWDKYNLLWE